MNLRTSIGATALLALGVSTLTGCGSTSDSSTGSTGSYAIQRVCVPQQIVLSDTNCPGKGWLYITRSTWNRQGFAMGDRIPADLGSRHRPARRDKVTYLYDLADTRIATIPAAAQPVTANTVSPRSKLTPAATPTSATKRTPAAKTKAPVHKSSPPRTTMDTAEAPTTAAAARTAATRRSSNGRRGHR